VLEVIDFESPAGLLLMVFEQPIKVTVGRENFIICSARQVVLSDNEPGGKSISIPTPAFECIGILFQ
jgi:hypothetical protein